MRLVYLLILVLMVVPLRAHACKRTVQAEAAEIDRALTDAVAKHEPGGAELDSVTKLEKGVYHVQLKLASGTKVSRKYKIRWAHSSGGADKNQCPQAIAEILK